MKLYSYQEDGVRHLTQPGRRVLYLADEPGLGKTIQAITATRQLGAASVLVICPAAIVNQWQGQLTGFAEPRVVSYDSFGTSSLTADEKRGIGNAMVISRKKAALALRKQLCRPWDVIIVDEAHAIKERGSERTKWLLNAKYGLLNQAQMKVFLLSGTPVLNRPAELYPVLRACAPDIIADLPSWEAYAYRYCDYRPGYNGSFDANGASNLEELGSRLIGFMLRRTKATLGKKLPRIYFRESAITILDTIDPDLPVATKRRLTGENKFKHLIEDIKNRATEYGKMVVFFYHKSVLAELRKIYPWAPVIQGGLTSHCKQNEIKRFSYKNNHSIILVQLNAGGVGLDGLQYVSNVCYVAELDWTPALIEQAVSRLHRLGQTQDVIVHFPVGRKNGLDGRLQELLSQKRETIAQVLLHVTRDLLIEGNFTMTEFLPAITLLERIAISLEQLAFGGEAAPAKTEKPAGKGKKAAPEKIDDVPPPAPVDMGVAEARQQLTELLNSDLTLKDARLAAYKGVLKDFGIEKVDQAAGKGQVQQVFDASVAAMNAVQAAGDDGDLI